MSIDNTMGSGASRSSVNDVTHITTNNSDSTEIPELVTHRYDKLKLSNSSFQNSIRLLF